MPLRTIIIKATRSGTASTVIIRRGASGTGTGGTGDHGALDGLGDDDHTQYHTDARGDARYQAKSATLTATTASFTTAQEAKLAGIEAGATGDQDLSSYATTSALAGKASLAATNNFTATQTFAQPVYLSGAVMGTVTTPIAGAYNGPGTGLTGTAQDLIVGQAFTANALTSILPITSGGTGAANLDALQPKITSLNASGIRTDLGLGVGQSPTFAGQTLTAPLQISGSATIGGVGQSLFNFSADGAGRIFGTSGNTPFLHVRQSTGKFVRIGPTSISYGTTGTIPTMNLTMDGGVFAFDAAIESTTATAGLILKSPDGTRYRVTVANGGGLTTTLLT